MPGMPPSSASSTATSTSSTTQSTTTSSTTGTTSTPPAAAGGDPLNQLFGQLISSMSQQQGVGQMPPAAAPQANVLPPEQRFQIQLEQLANMGFHDRSANIQGKKKIIFHKSPLLDFLWLGVLL